MIDDDGILPIELFEQRVDPLRSGSRNVLANEVGADGHFTMASVEQHRQLNRGWSAKVHDGVDRGSNGTTRIQDLIDKHDVQSSEVSWQGAGSDVWPTSGEVVPIEGDIEDAHRRADPFDLLNHDREAFGERSSSSEDTDERESFRSVIPFDDLVSDAYKGAPHLVAIHHLSSLHRRSIKRKTRRFRGVNRRIGALRALTCVGDVDPAFPAAASDAEPFGGLAGHT